MARLNMYLDGKLVESVHYRLTITKYEDYQKELVETLKEKHRLLISRAIHLPVFVIEGVESSFCKKQHKPIPGRPRIPKWKDARVLYMRSEGRTIKDIALETGISERKVSYIINQAAYVKGLFQKTK